MLINSTTIIVIFLILGVERDVVERRSKATGAKYTGVCPSKQFNFKKLFIVQPSYDDH